MTTRDTIIRQIHQEKVIAILRGLTVEQCADTAEALYRGGIRFVEITFDQSGGIPHSETLRAISLLRGRMDGKLQIGAGTVLSAMQAAEAKQAGAMYCISPDVNEKVIAATREQEMVSIPGAMTPTEAVTAWHCGADFVKIFPAGNLGPAYCRALLGPLSFIPFLAVGGIHESNLRDFLSAGYAGAGIGGSLVDRKAIDAGNFAAIETAAEHIVRAAGAWE